MNVQRCQSNTNFGAQTKTVVSLQDEMVKLVEKGFSCVLNNKTGLTDVFDNKTGTCIVRLKEAESNAGKSAKKHLPVYA